jgi:hypothetical protein
MVAGFLFSGGSGNTISWMVLPILRLEWDMIATYSWGPLHYLGCAVHYVTATGGPVRMSTSVVVHTSYMFRCGSVS